MEEKLKGAFAKVKSNAQNKNKKNEWKILCESLRKINNLVPTFRSYLMSNTHGAIDEPL